MKKSTYLVRDPWRTRAIRTFHRCVTCQIRGHDWLEKFDGTLICRRH